MGFGLLFSLLLFKYTSHPYYSTSWVGSLSPPLSRQGQAEGNKDERLINAPHSDSLTVSTAWLFPDPLFHHNLELSRKNAHWSPFREPVS